jgi:hypothetical protein
VRLKLGILVALALGLSGCGVLDDVGPATQATPDPAVYGPSRATNNDSPPAGELPVPPKVAPSPKVASELDDGQVGVVAVTGAVGVKPPSLDTAADLTVSDLQWSAWSATGAAGQGRLRLPSCQPTCADGATTEVPARVELSGLKTCDGRRYYDHAEVRVDPEDAPSGLQPASYVRAPC